jgi:predicted RNase H-like HicB family nuclease
MNEPVPYKIKYEVYPEDGIFVARCLNIDVASDGASEEEALENLREAIELYFERNAEALISQRDEDSEDRD